MTAEAFNKTQISRWINSGRGQAFRLCAGIAFLVLGIIYRTSPLGIASIVWSIFPLSAGLFDLCFISGLLGGPWKGSQIRPYQTKSE